MLGTHERSSMREHETGRAPGADEACAICQFEIARAIDAGREHERSARLGGMVDRALQGAALVVRPAGAHAKARSIDAEPGERRSGSRGGQRSRGSRQKKSSVK